VTMCDFLPGGYIVGGEAARLVRETILELCAELKDDSVSLVDALAPPDFILGSPIGQSDGEVSLDWLTGGLCFGWLVLSEKHKSVLFAT